MADYQLTQSGSQVQTALDKVGTVALDTTATELSSAVNELLGTIGTDPILTTAQTLTGAVNELDAEVAQNTSDISALFALAPSLGTISDHNGSCEIGDLLIQWGGESVTPTANAVTTVNVTFDKTYANAPFVGVTVRSTSINQITGFGCTGTNTTGTTLRFYRTNTTSTTIGWIAIGKKASGGSLNSINPITPINLNPLSPSVVNEEEEEM